ncbi:MAG: hypothetical protein DHS20C12_27690 [Pseudohongiella sp.]|nr:MAG: hypothetical protein DHS20C12_27690 [Pseudohongiella sp.]
MCRTRPTILLFFLSLVLCANASAQPLDAFYQFEQRLLDSKNLDLPFHVVATGAVEANIRGTLRKRENGDIELSAAGSFAGQELDLIAALRDERFMYGNRLNPVSGEAPADLWRSLVIGLTRMGVLHNIANLSANTIPDHAGGGVADWVTVTNMQNIEESFAFDIVVADTPSGSATLAFDKLGFPGIRHQTVAFPGGEMRVVETYVEAFRNE